MNEKQAGALIIENIAMLEEANALLKGELSETVFSAVDRIVETWVKRMEWDGYFDFSANASTGFGLDQWRVTKEDSEEWCAYFCIDSIVPADDDEYWLTTLVAARNSRIGFRFYVDRDYLSTVNKRAWKTFASQKNREFPEIEKVGFQFEPDEGTWVLPWRIDAKSLAENYSTATVEDALGPVTEALGKVEAVSPAFSKLVEAAQREFGVNHLT